MPEVLLTKTQQPSHRTQTSWHWINLVLNITLLGSIIGCFVYGQAADDIPVEFFIFLGILYLIYLIECCCSGSQKYLISNDAVEKEDYMQKIKTAAPRIGTKIECYHYVTKNNKDLESQNTGGISQIREKMMSKEKVVTFTETSYFEYKAWEDATDEVLTTANFLRLDIVKQIVFDSPESELKFETYRKEFVESHRGRDEHISVVPIFEIDGYRDSVLLQSKWANRSCFLDVGWFWFFSFVLLSWPYRMWFESISQTRNVALKKRISV